MTEVCQKCGKTGEDRRTLWMACFYAMQELAMPLEETSLFVADENSVKTEMKTGTITSTPYTEHGPGEPETRPFKYPNYHYSGEVREQLFYTLRVCKGCRADWMAAIECWFKTPVAQKYLGSGIFIRENGAVKEITEEGWRARQALDEHEKEGRDGPAGC